MKDKEKQNISMKEMLTKRSFEPITNCNCKIESRIDYAVRNENKDGAFVYLLNQEQAELQKTMQIEEMAKAICSACNDGVATCNRKPCSLAIEEATAVFNLGCRKLPEDSVVLSREKYEKLKNESIDKLFADDTFFKEEFKANEEYLRKRANRDYIKLIKKQASKETAEKFYEFAKAWFVDEEQNDYFEEVKNFAKQLGVEIKEYEK